MAQLITKSKRIILSTHRQCDGDGLGSQLGLYFALRKINKSVQIINFDETPRKYKFLNPDAHIQYFTKNPNIDLSSDLCLVFDTNDERLLGDLYTALMKVCKQVLFVDHHPLLEQGPQPSLDSLIDISAASTGELTYRIIKALNIPLDTNIARCLYTSITFDTQLYRYVRGSAESHLIAAELLQHNIEPHNIHRALFGNQTVQKMAFIAQALGRIEYFFDGSLAVLRFKESDLMQHNLEADDSRDVIDMIMNIETLEAAVIFREDEVDQFKVSIRSKDKFEVLSIAEDMGGGGHKHASGAYVKGNFDDLKAKVIAKIKDKLKLTTP